MKSSELKIGYWEAEMAKFLTLIELASFLWHVAGWLFSNGG